MSISTSKRRAIMNIPWGDILIDDISFQIDKRHHDLCLVLNGEPIWYFYKWLGKYASSYYSDVHDRRLLRFFRSYRDKSRNDLLELVHTRHSHTSGHIEYENWEPALGYIIDGEPNPDPYDLLDILLAADRRIALWRLGRLLLITNCAVTRRIIGYRYEQKETPPHNLHGG